MDADATDRLALQDLAFAYGAMADRRDVDGFTALFLPDATLTARRGNGDPAVYQGAERLAEIPARLGRYDETFHAVTNHRCEISGDSATGEAACRAHHVTAGADGATDVILTIRYRDTYQRTAAGWRFATRDVHILWTSEEPVTLA